MSTKAEREETEAARLKNAQELRDLFARQGITRLHCILRRVSASGMTRHISILVPVDMGIESAHQGYTLDRQNRATDIWDISASVARVLGDRFHPDTGGVVVGGCGMDMGFHLVYNLAATLYRDQPRESWPLQGRDNHSYPYSLEHHWI